MHNFYILLQSTCHVVPTTTSTTVPSTLPTTTETPPAIFKTCTTNAECPVTDSECRDGTCQCTLGLSHDPATDTCTPCKYIGAGSSCHITPLLCPAFYVCCLRMYMYIGAYFRQYYIMEANTMHSYLAPRL